jgi:hypothetical protein
MARVGWSAALLAGFVFFELRAGRFNGFQFGGLWLLAVVLFCWIDFIVWVDAARFGKHWRSDEFRRYVENR